MSTDEQHLVPASRRRGGLAATRGGHQESERSFFCRICQRAERGLWVPAGWYLLERAPGGKGRHVRLGLYCSVACLVRAGEMLEAGAAEHAARMDLPTEEDRRRERARIIEIAQTLLSGGLTIRHAAENLNVETFTLKTWLKEASIQISPPPSLSAPVTAKTTATATRSSGPSSGTDPDERAERADPAGSYRGGRLDGELDRPLARAGLHRGRRHPPARHEHAGPQSGERSQ
ncbi:hypothetical protein ABT061_40320 [Streptosporangium sp. NPDC002544]|uniref:hypothetical protein n=1 Tax=Streptosporangium sp. NPDC002544 TaxID=3154538 RepID=UPI003321A8B5